MWTNHEFSEIEMVDGFVFYIFMWLHSDIQRRAKKQMEEKECRRINRMYDLTTFDVNLSRISITNRHRRCRFHTNTNNLEWMDGWMENDPSDFGENPRVWHLLNCICVCIKRESFSFKPGLYTVHQTTVLTF